MKKEIFNGFTLFVLAACLLNLTLNMINGRFGLADFRVYYTAAANLLSGGQVYLVSFDGGSGFYKYSPATLYFFAPYTIFNLRAASLIHYFVLGVAYWYAFTVIRRLIKGYILPGNSKHGLWLLSLSFLCIMIHFTREMYLGNINIILLALCCLAVLNFLEAKDLPGGILLGIAILLKPYLLILLLPLVLRKKWKALAWSCTAALGIMILPFIVPGPHAGTSLYRDWMTSVKLHGEGFPGKTSLDYIAGNLIPAWPSWGILAILLASLVMVSVFILDNLRREKLQESTAGMELTYEWFLLIALLPNLVRTDWVLMLFSAPLICFMIFHITAYKRYFWIPVLVIFLFFYGANSDDLLGRSLSQAILQKGLMGLANFMLVLLSLIMFVDQRKRDKGNQHGDYSLRS